MRKRVTKLLSVLFITSSLLVALFPFFIVKADNPTYLPLDSSNGCTQLFTNNTGRYQNIQILNGNVRIVVVGERSNYCYLYIVSDTQFTFYDGLSTSGCSVGNYINTASAMNNHSGYYAYAIEYNTYFTNIAGYPVILSPGIGNLSDAAFNYTYGSSHVDPSPPAPIYGDLIIDGYSTDIAGQGDASINNIDHILWNGFVDTNGNDISNLQVRLQIVPGTYTSDSKAHLLEKTYEDLILDINSAHEQVYDASLGEVSFKWSDIVNMLNITPYKLWSLQLFGVDWQKEGWIYRIRLEDSENEYVGNWQTIYSSTSSGVQNDLTIINSNSIDQTYITALQEVNNLNTVNNNWIVNNTEISVTNNYTEPASGDKPWWAYLLESILNTFHITNTYINEGNENTYNITNTVNNSDNNMNQKINEYQQYEDDFIQDMDDNLTDIDTDVPLLSNNKFINSANWVAQQYNRMTNNTVIGSLLGFSLVFGLALIFIGRIR